MWLWSQHVEEELTDPPDDWIAVQTRNSLDQICRHRLWKERGSWIDTVNYWKFHDLGVLFAGPAGPGTALSICAGFAEGQKDILKSLLVVPPPF